MAGTGTLNVNSGQATAPKAGDTLPIVQVNTLPPSGQDVPANSLPVVLDSTVETAVGTAGSRAVTIQGAATGTPVPVSSADGGLVSVGAKADQAPVSPAASGSVVAKLTGIWTALLGLPTSLGQKAMAASLSVTVAGDQVAIPMSLADGQNSSFGAKGDPVAANPGASASYMAKFSGFWTNWLARVPVLGSALSAASMPVVIASDQASIPVIPAAGELHLGEIGGNIAKAQAQFGPSTSTAYASGQCMAAPIALVLARKNNGSFVLSGGTLALAVLNTVEVDLVVFSIQPTLASYVAGSAYPVVAADRPKIVAILKVTDWTVLGTTDSVGEVVAGSKLITCDDTTALTTVWVVPVARGSITLASATDATITLRASRN